MNVTDFFENRPDEADVSAIRCCGGECASCAVVLNEEHTLKLFSEEMLLHTFVCSPGELGELCAGWLYSEGYEFSSVEVSEDGSAAVAKGVTAAKHSEKGEYPTVSADPEEMLRLFSAASEKYSRSHGVHECVLKGNGWHVIRTDIGRHNAIDKAIGAVLLQGKDPAGAVMFTSGRINEQTVNKALNSGVSCLMSKAVITRSALELAEERDLRVLFMVRNGSFMTR